jgi:hypothetical protein
MNLYAIVCEHNRLNGLGFSAVEYLVVTVVVLVMTVLGAWPLLVGVGIAANIVMVVIVAVLQ